MPSPLPRVASDRLLVWSGAGISAEQPTGAPLGDALTARALSYGFLPETGDLLRCYYDDLGLTRSRPRLETLIDVVSRVHGLAAVVDLLSDVATAVPNAIHTFLAANRAVSHVTANFDSCLEQAGATDVFHFHGSLAADPTAATLGATLAGIERGFPPWILAELDRRIAVCDSMLVVGYSGSDYFDVDRYFAALPPKSLEGKIVIWVRHAAGPMNVVSGPAAAGQISQLAMLAKMGAHVYLIEAETRAFLGGLASSWGIAPPASAYFSNHEWKASSEPTRDMKAVASLELYSLMGLKREVERLVEYPTTKIDPRRRAALLGDVRWFQGRYREAAALRRDASSDDPMSRQATDFWIRGQYLRARHAALRAVKAADASIGTADELPLTERLVRAETLARVWAHMRRVPDARMFATKRLRDFALAHLPDPAELARDGQPLGAHHDIRVRDARRALGAESEPAFDSIETFGQYEALGAWMNYRHGRLRADVQAGQTVAPERYRQLQRDHVVLGAEGDAARVIFIPGAARVFSPNEILAALRTLDFTPWHRFRLSALLLFRRYWR